MTKLLRAIFASALLSAAVPTVVRAQTASVDSLLRRIEQLERRAGDLEQRVHDLEESRKGAAAQARSVSTSANWRDIQNWRRLRLKMTMDQVRALLGEPERVDVLGPYTVWRWESGYASVTFLNDSGKLENWSEPRN